MPVQSPIPVHYQTKKYLQKRKGYGYQLETAVKFKNEQLVAEQDMFGGDDFSQEEQQEEDLSNEDNQKEEESEEE